MRDAELSSSVSRVRFPALATPSEFALDNLTSPAILPIDDNSVTIKPVCDTKESAINAGFLFASAMGARRRRKNLVLGLDLGLDRGIWGLLYSICDDTLAYLHG